MYYLLLAVCVLGVFSDDSPYMDPSHQPVSNLNAAARGYNIYIGAPFSQNLMDPGFRGQIFKMTKADKQGRIQLHPGVESEKILSCRVNMEGKVITSVKQYLEAQKSSLIIGEGWQIGEEVKVTVGADIGVANINLEATFDPFLNSESTDKLSTENMESFFTKEKGAIVQLKATCVKNWIRLSRYLTPKFRKGFIEGLKRLYSASPKERENEFKTFISVFGTHYSEETAMGSRMVYSRRFTNTEKQLLSKQGIIDCTKKHSKFLWGTYSTKRNECATDAGSGRDINSQYMNREHLSSVGSKPFPDLEKWVQQEMKEPVPIKMRLRPIVELFTPQNLAKLNINATQMVDWYLPIYLNSCSLMNYRCTEGALICGVWDNCDYGETCIENGTTHYYCQRSNVTLYWRRHRNVEDISPDTIRVLTMGAESVMEIERPRCSSRYCNWTINALELTRNHIFTVEPKPNFYAWTTEFGKDKWITNHNANIHIEFLRIPHAIGYWINIVDTETGNILIRYMKQCQTGQNYLFDKESTGVSCFTRFHGNMAMRYNITVASEMTVPHRGKYYVVEKIVQKADPTVLRLLRCDKENPDFMCDNVSYLNNYLPS